MSEMIERAAKAAWMRYVGIDDESIAECDWLDPDDRTARIARREDWPHDTGLYPDADQFRKCARAAIEAMREPTPEMTAAAWGAPISWRAMCEGGSTIDLVGLYRSMIDEVLK